MNVWILAQHFKFCLVGAKTNVFFIGRLSGGQLLPDSPIKKRWQNLAQALFGQSWQSFMHEEAFSGRAGRSPKIYTLVIYGRK